MILLVPIMLTAGPNGGNDRPANDWQMDDSGVTREAGPRGDAVGRGQGP